MPTYCNEGDKPIIKYRFGGDTKDRTYKSSFAPIEVTAEEKPVNTGDNYNKEGYGLNYTITDGNAPRSRIVLAHTVQFINLFSGYWGLFTINCGSTNQSFPRTFSGGGVSIHPNSISIDNTKKCPEEANKRCSIEVKRNGLIIFQDQGNCPVSFSVQCGKCPDGKHECKSKIYPYYCCNDCAGTAKKINDIAAKIRGY